MSRFKLIPAALLATTFLVFVPTTEAVGSVSLASFQQCANGTGTATSCAGGWVNGGLGSGNSHYREDDSVPQRIAMNLTDGAEYTVTINYMARKGGKHTYDSLATWNYTTTTADPCQGLAASICSGTPSTLQMASDSTVVPPIGAGIASASTNGAGVLANSHELPAADRKWTMYGAELISTTAVTHSAAANQNADDTASVTLKFKSTSASGGPAVLLFGGHVAVSGGPSQPRAWGVDLGGSHAPGSSYHIDNSLGGGDNQLQAGAVQSLTPAAFTITKTVDGQSSITASTGQQVEYKVTVKNTGQQSGSTTFVDNFDDAVDPSAVSGGTCNEAGGQLSCTTSTINGGGEQVFTYTANMPASFTKDPGGTPCSSTQFLVKNTATLANGSSASSSVCVTAASSFSITKTTDATPVGSGNPQKYTASPGQLVEYKVVVKNTGTANGSTTFVDDFDGSIDPSAVSGGTCDEAGGQLSCQTGSLAPNAEKTFTYTAAMPSTFSGESGGGVCDAGEYPVDNTATLANDGGSDAVTVCIAAAPDFTISKKTNLDSGETVGPGDSVTYTVTVKNVGTAAGSIEFVDDFDDALDFTGDDADIPTGCELVVDEDTSNESFSCETNPLAADEDQTFTYTVSMPTSFTGPSGGGDCDDGAYPVVNTATIAGVDPASTTVCVVASPAFSIEKTSNVPEGEIVAPGALVTYKVVVKNTGAAPGSTGFVDDYDDRVTDDDDPSGASITDGSCVKSTLGNDVLLCETGDLDPGESQEFTYTAHMPLSFSTAPEEGCEDASDYPIVNTATVEGDDPSTVTVCVDTEAAFTVEKSSEIGDDETAEPGQSVEYTITVTNAGSEPGSTSFTDEFEGTLDEDVAIASDPTGADCDVDGNVISCETGSINPGQTQTITYNVLMPDTFTGASGGGVCDDGEYPIVNELTPDEGAPQSVTVCVAAAPDLVVHKTSDAHNPVAPGTTVEYTVTVTNNGSAPGATTFTDDFANSIDPSAVTSAGGSCEEDGGILTCTTGTIEAGESRDFTYTADMPTTFSGTPDDGCEDGEYPIFNLVTLLSPSSQGVDSETVCVTAAPKFVIEKSASTASTTPGQPVTYTITVTNKGSLAGSTTFVDDFDDVLDFTGDDADIPAGCELVDGDDDNESLSCTTGSIDPSGPNDHQTFTYTVNMPDSFTGTPAEGCQDPTDYPVVNTVELNAATEENEDDDDSVTVCVDTEAGFSIAKAADLADDATVLPGQSVKYTITVENIGSEPGSTSFTDEFEGTLDEDVAISSDPTGADCDVAGNVLSCETSSIDPDETQTITYNVLMPASFTGESGAEPCRAGEFPIVNDVSIDDGGPSASETVCVTAAPDITFEKTADADSAGPGDPVTYTIVATNHGKAAGSGSYVDDFDDRLDFSGDDADIPDGCELLTDGGNERFSCETDTILAGATQTFQYTVDMPKTFEGDPDDTETCSGYEVVNTVLVGGEEETGATVCVDAAPDFDVDKTSDVEEGESASPGQTVNYTITVRNIGSAPGATSFTDDFEDVLEPTLPATVPPGGGSCEEGTGENRTFECETTSIPAGGERIFKYSAAMPLTFTGEPGTDERCGEDEYAIDNDVQIGDEGAGDSVLVCVKTEPKLAVTKSVDKDTVGPSEAVKYTLTVSNTGSAPGSTTFVDDFDDVLDPALPTSASQGGECTLLTDGGNERFSCDSGSVPAGGAKVFTYTAEMPATFTGASGGGTCDAGEYPIVNAVAIGDDEPQEVTVCVTAAPELSLVKSLQDHETDENGTEFLTYRLTYTNAGPAEAPTAMIHDAIPASTAYVSCTGGCVTTGNPKVTSADWAVGPVAPKGGTGSVTLTVRVTGNESCQVTNVASIRFGLGDPMSSNSVTTNVTPKGDPAGAHAIGNARGIQVLASGLLNLGGAQAPLSLSATSQTGPGGPVLDDDSLLNIKVGNLVKADVLTTTSSSMVTPAPNEARHTATSEVGHICVLPVAGICTVEADAVRAVSSTTANGSTATVSSAGSTITRLKIAGIVTPVDLNQTTRIPLPAGVFGKNSFVTIGERSGPGVGAQPRAGLVGDAYMADQTVTMIHVKITGLLGLQKAEVIVAQAVSHSDYPASKVCSGAVNRTVSGHALVAGLHTAPILENILQGYVQISPLGGAESQHVAGVNVPASGKIVSALAGDSSSVGSISGTQATSHSYAELAGNTASPACVLKSAATCVVKATAVRAESRTTAKASGASSVDSGTTIANLSVLGIPITVTGEPNQVITLPGIGFVVINEQLCDNGVNTNTHTCTGATHSGLTVRGVRVFITVANNLLGITPGIDLVVAEAHSDATFAQAAS